MPKPTTMPETVLEIVHFQIDDAVSEATFISLFIQTEALLRCQEGFLSRQLIRADHGRWSDLVLWRSRPEALTAAARVTRDPAFASYLAAIRRETVEMAHHRVLAAMGG